MTGWDHAQDEDHGGPRGEVEELDIEQKEEREGNKKHW
jgi:hypothetical protein